MSTPPPSIDNADLESAFRYNGGQPINFEDVEVAEWTDESDEPSFAWLLKLRDGRWAFASGGHDCTGWDCQSGLDVTVWNTKREAIRMGMTLNDRENLGLLLPGEKL